MARQKKQNKKAVLVLEDGRTFQGESFGADGETLGEVVFNTSLTGYQEILCDPSYDNQIITFTNPHIGNTGVNSTDVESEKVRAAGMIVRECSRNYSSWRAEKSLDEYLREQNIVGIQGIDTRALTLHIREKGAMKGILSSVDYNYETLMKKLFKYPSMAGRNLVDNVTTCESTIFKPNTEPERIANYYEYTDDTPEDIMNTEKDDPEIEDMYHVVAVDFGIKYNIPRIFSYFNCRVIVVPASYTFAEIMSLNPDGVFLSNGPGDPSTVKGGIEMVQNLVNQRPDIPIFGICLGHQILGLAFGAKSFKLKFGHRGSNHPVKDIETGKIEITTQNHGFAIACSQDESGKLVIDDCEDLEVTHINLNDHTLEGFRHKSLPVFSVQYHPESSSGPHDSWYLFKRFIAMMASRREEAVAESN